MVRKFISIRIFFTSDMLDDELTSIVCYDFLDFGEKLFDIRIFDFIFTSKLLDHELTVHIEGELGRFVLEREMESIDGSPILCLVIGTMTERLVALVDHDSRIIEDHKTTPRRSRISSGSSICIYTEIHTGMIRGNSEYQILNVQYRQLLILHA